MLFLHLIDDYKIQGILANLKQREWWKENAPNPLYKNDYKVALIEHGFSWAFTISLPFLYVAITQNNLALGIFVIINYFVNALIHAFIDNLKANEHIISLTTDQLLHWIQIGSFWFIGCMLF